MRTLKSKHTVGGITVATPLPPEGMPTVTASTNSVTFESRRTDFAPDVSPAQARALADDHHKAELEPLMENASATIRLAAAKGAYSTTIAAKEPLLTTLADRLTRAGYVTRQMAQGLLVQWS